MVKKLTLAQKKAEFNRIVKIRKMINMSLKKLEYGYGWEEMADADSLVIKARDKLLGSIK